MKIKIKKKDYLVFEKSIIIILLFKKILMVKNVDNNLFYWIKILYSFITT